MRIIAGDLRGKKLLIPNDNFTRPLKDAVKESIFNIIQHSKLLNCDLSNSSILDLFSGVGTFGLECISRNSKHVTFFENHLPAIKMLKKNIQNLNCFSKTKIIEKDVFSLEKLNTDIKNYEFIFLDPPFKEIRIKFLLNILKNKKVFKKESIVLIHRDKNTLDHFPEDFKVIIDKKYGRSRILFGKFI